MADQIEYAMRRGDDGVFVTVDGEMTLEQCAESRLCQPITPGRAREVALSILTGIDISERIRSQ
ncbi:hypothetical protein ACLQ3C_09275 [Gordonia sp. DT30]|uniref:hypothetical protein n=1 Tax=Gordonia sp. DT30 TaxID=3416546 RepID=UPI003CF3AFA4